MLYLSNPKGVTAKDQRSLIDSVNKLNLARNASLRDPEISTKVSQYEMAFRMQTSVPELMDVSNEPKHVLDLYGAKPGDGSFASNCILARRLAERGVRFIHLYHRGWDHHGGVKNAITGVAKRCRPRLCGTHSGPQTKRHARRHPRSLGRRIRTHPHGAKAMDATTTSKAFPSGWRAEESKAESLTATPTNSATTPRRTQCTRRDFHATMLHQLGIQSQLFTHKYQGLDFRLTGVDEEAHALKDILA